MKFAPVNDNLVRVEDEPSNAVSSMVDMGVLTNEISLSPAGRLPAGIDVIVLPCVGNTVKDTKLYIIVLLQYIQITDTTTDVEPNTPK